MGLEIRNQLQDLGVAIFQVRARVHVIEELLLSFKVINLMSRLLVDRSNYALVPRLVLSFMHRLSLCSASLPAQSASWLFNGDIWRHNLELWLLIRERGSLYWVLE